MTQVTTTTQAIVEETGLTGDEITIIVIVVGILIAMIFFMIGAGEQMKYMP